MIDALFGSKTRVKLLHLFLNNPGKSFYVREITRIIDEQINSVRRELANMLNVGVITSDTADNKLYYQVNQRFEYYVPFRAIFASQPSVSTTEPIMDISTPSWHDKLRELAHARVIILSGVLAGNKASTVDVLVAGPVSQQLLKKIIKTIENQEGREINYTLLSYDDFYYRMSVRDKFISNILGGKYIKLVDTENLLKEPA